MEISRAMMNFQETCHALGRRLERVVVRQRDKTATEITKALLKKGVVVHCHDCGHEIYKYDDDAWVCIECGGRNRRVPHN